MTNNTDAKQYIVITIVGAKNEIQYTTKVSARSALGAEHAVLDKAYVGKHESTVKMCQAFDAEGVASEDFIRALMRSEMVSVQELFAIIEDANEEMMRMDDAENTIIRCERQIAELQKQIEEAKKVLE